MNKVFVTVLQIWMQQLRTHVKPEKRISADSGSEELKFNNGQKTVATSPDNSTDEHEGENPNNDPGDGATTEKTPAAVTGFDLQRAVTKHIDRTQCRIQKKQVNI